MKVFSIIKKSFVQFYEHLFKLVLIDIIWFFLVASLLYLGYAGLQNSWLLPLVLSVIFTGPLLLSGLHISDRLVIKDDPTIKDFFTGIITYFKRGFLAFLFSLSIYALLIIDLIFFQQKGDNIVFLIISIFFFYLIIFFSMMQIYFWGLLTVKNEETIRQIIKQSFYLTLDNALFSFLLLILTIVLVIILTLTGVGLPILFIGLIGLLISNGTRCTLEKYQN